MRYPTLDELLTLHQLALDAYGGAAGLRDLGALQSALATPRQVVFGEELYPTLADKAAILLYLLVQNHPFTIAIASGRLDKDAVMAWMQEHLRPLDKMASCPTTAG